MNMVALIGNVASDIELRHTSAGKAVANFRIAVNRTGDTADFFTITAWERQAEVVNEFLAKGRRVGIEGRLLHSTWETEGKKHSKVEVVAHRITFLGAPEAEAADTAQDAAATPDGAFVY